MASARTYALWAVFGLATTIPIIAAALSPLLQYRQWIYILGGFAGIIGFSLLLVQSVLAGRFLPGLTPMQARRLHQTSGILLVIMVVAHVVGLWITSPPDVIDVLLFRSPTPFAIWGAIAMWAVFATAALAAFKRRLKLKPRTWRRLHLALAITIAVGTIVHAVQIDGAMEWYSKLALCALVGLATAMIAKKVFA